MTGPVPRSRRTRAWRRFRMFLLDVSAPRIVLRWVWRRQNASARADHRQHMGWPR